MSEAVSRLRQEIGDMVGDFEGSDGNNIEETSSNETWKKPALAHLRDQLNLSDSAADQLVTYLATSKAALGVMPTQDTIILERFFDEAGDMHLVVHSPFGNRVNRAWGLALRKRFCRKFNFELQAAATEDNIILSLGATHSFPLEEVFSYLHQKSVRRVLIQALLDAPMFEVRWRWNATCALAILRRRGGQKVPPQIQRSQSEDLIALVFPDQLACLENIAGEREIPDHPLVHQTIHDCLTEAMDIEQLEKLIAEIRSGKKKLITRDLREPSPMAQEILSAKPYAFLDDAPAEERRTNAVQSRRWLDPATVKELGHLDFAAIQTVKLESWPQVESADELHDALVMYGFLTEGEGNSGDGLSSWQGYLDILMREGRATKLILSDCEKLWISIERIPQLRKIYGEAALLHELHLPDSLKEKKWDADTALVEIIRGRLEALGPVTIPQLADSMALSSEKIEKALVLLEADGFVLRGHFSQGIEEMEWCERRLLARIHRYTLRKLRKEIEPVSSADFMRFLFSWQHVDKENKLEGSQALLEIIDQLQGYEAPAASWEGDILPLRLKDYDFLWLDFLCLSGKISWGRLRPDILKRNNGEKKHHGPIKSSPLSLIARDQYHIWRRGILPENISIHLSGAAGNIYEVLKEKGACFFNDIEKNTGLLKVQVEDGLSELVASGLVTSDSFTGLRALLVPIKYKSGRRRGRKLMFTMEQAGRWSPLPSDNLKASNEWEEREINVAGMQLLRRYGVVFRKLLDNEALSPTWRELTKLFRKWEAQGKIRGGRFVEGVWGEQFALPEAIPILRKIRKTEKKNTQVSISAADPLNLVGIITPGARIPKYYRNRILFEDGIPIAWTEGKEIKYSKEYSPKMQWDYKNALLQREISPKLRAYLGKGIA